MKIRYKLASLMLAVSILPIIAIIVLLQQSVERVSERVTRDIQQAQMQDTLERLTVHLHNYRETIMSASNSLLLSLKLQAEEVEKRLAENVPADAKAGDEFGLDTKLDDLTRMRAAWHKSYPKDVNFRRQELLLAPGTRPDDVRADLCRLQGMTKVYNDQYQAHRGLTLWHYTSLEDGIHTYYPGGGSLPQGYNPKVRPWYTRAKESHDKWAVCLVYDAVTQAFILTISMPVYRPDGSFAGVTAIDTPMDKIFQGLTLPVSLADHVQVFWAGLEVPGEEVTNNNVLHAFMQAGKTQGDTLWRTKPELPLLTSSDREPYQAMMNNLIAGRAGTQIMEYKGEKSVWGYSARIGEKGALHMIMPYKSVLALAEQTRQNLFAENAKQIRAAALILLLIVVVTFVTAVIYARRFTSPINQLAAVAGKLSQGDFAAKADVKTGDELQQLATVFNDVGPKLEQHQKTQQSLVLAGAIQKHLLPKKPPTLTRFQIAGRSQYCDETGGDYYDFIVPRETDKRWVGVVLGDVSGHGIASALVMASARSFLRNAATYLGTDLVKLMYSFNDALSEDIQDDKFMTLFYGVLNDVDRSMIWASGGQDPAIWFHRREGTFEELGNTGPLMGCMPGMDFEQAGPISLQENDVILIGTDGIWEAMDSSGNPYGKDRLMALIAANSGKTAEEIVSLIVASVNDFVKPATPADDITLIVVKGLA